MRLPCRFRWCQPVQRRHEPWLRSDQPLQRHEPYVSWFWLLAHLARLLPDVAGPRSHQPELPGHFSKLWLAIKPGIHPHLPVVLSYLACLQWQQGLTNFALILADVAILLADVTFVLSHLPQLQPDLASCPRSRQRDFAQVLADLAKLQSHIAHFACLLTHIAGILADVSEVWRSWWQWCFANVA